MKNKLGLSLLTGLTTLSVATPLATSCAKTNKLINHVHESEEDKLYGINANTYESLKKDYTNQYQDKLLERGYIEGSDDWKQEMNNLNSSLNVFDEKSKTMEMSYGQLTSGLMMYAKVNDRLSLRRTTNAKPSDVDDMYQGARNSFDLYMDQLGFSSDVKTRVLTNADNKFGVLKTQLQAKGTMENDPYGALQDAKMSLLDFFADINAQIARQAALITITQFKKLYSISLKPKFNFSNFKEKLDEAKGKQISDDLMNQMFDFIDIENGSTITFRTNIMAGYILTPILNDVRYNAESNTNEIDVAWSCINSTYLQTNDAETIKKATAYQYDLPDKNKLDKIMKSDQYTADDIFEICKVKVDTSNGYFVYEDEKANLSNTYFNKNSEYKISFQMPDASDPHAKCDPFYFGPDAIKEVGGTGKLSMESLAKTGIKISCDGEKYEYLSDVMTSALAQNFDEKNATLSEKFARNCELYAEIKETDRSKHAVTVKLVTRYRNSCLSQSDSYDLTKWMDVNTVYSINAPLSEELFQEYSKNYSRALDYVDVYLSNKASTDMLLQKVFLGVSCLVTAINIAGIIFVAYLMTQEKIEKKHIIYLVIMSLGAATGFAAIGIFSKLVDDGRNFSKKIDNFNKEPVVHETFEAIKTGKDIFVKMSAESEYTEYNPTEYAKKYSVFKDANPDEMKKYNNIFVDTVRDDGKFNQKAIEYQVSKPEVLTFIENHNISNGLVLAAYILFGCSTISAIASIIIIIYETNKAMRKREEMNKFEEAALLNVNRMTQDLFEIGEIWSCRFFMLCGTKGKIAALAEACVTAAEAKEIMEEEGVYFDLDSVPDVRRD